MNTDLSLYGWNEALFQQKQTSKFNKLAHGRVTITHKTCYEIISENGIFQCELTGNILYGKLPTEYPCTGDWVIFQPIDTLKGVIVDILPRSKTLYRRKSGTILEKQAIAVHVDKAFIIQSLDANFNIRRIERFIVQIKEEGITPVMVFTKADLNLNKDFITPLKHLSVEVPVFVTSIYSPDTIDALRRSVHQGETIVFTGSSGVGKSSLINALCNKDLLRTSSLSGSTGKGKHTSTRREMILLDSSGVLIDTPGVREFGITTSGTNVLSSVLDIANLERDCRFKNCSHTEEPGCAVIKALEEGLLNYAVYNSYLKLRKEAWHISSLEHEKRKREKSFSKMVKHVKRLKGDH